MTVSVTGLTPDCSRASGDGIFSAIAIEAPNPRPIQQRGSMLANDPSSCSFSLNSNVRSRREHPFQAAGATACGA